jgi:hypothetical protein
LFYALHAIENISGKAQTEGRTPTGIWSKMRIIYNNISVGNRIEFQIRDDKVLFFDKFIITRTTLVDEKIADVVKSLKTGTGKWQAELKF